MKKKKILLKQIKIKKKLLQYQKKMKKKKNSFLYKQIKIITKTKKKIL